MSVVAPEADHRGARSTRPTGRSERPGPRRLSAEPNRRQAPMVLLANHEEADQSSSAAPPEQVPIRSLATVPAPARQAYTRPWTPEPSPDGTPATRAGDPDHEPSRLAAPARSGGPYSLPAPQQAAPEFPQAVTPAAASELPAVSAPSPRQQHEISALSHHVQEALSVASAATSRAEPVERSQSVGADQPSLASHLSGGSKRGVTGQPRAASQARVATHLAAEHGENAQTGTALSARPATAGPGTNARPATAGPVRRLEASASSPSRQPRSAVSATAAQLRGSADSELPKPGAAAAFSRLTLRGQRVIVALGFVATIVAGAIVGTVFSGEQVGGAATDVVTVQPGDSLWQIAAGLAEPGDDLRPIIDQVQELNDLQGAQIHDGESLVIPAQD